ncbi:MAG: YidC/Oxa1 family membrane protein insertase [Patescibacteria group bacterium]|nr:YidC/Oxa1 family membrane protein insertase [Patescibacteria group bacterium]
MAIFFTLFYQPIFNFLVWLYNHLPGQDLGLAIIILTLVIRLILYIPSKKAIKAQKELASIQPEIDKIKEEYKNDKEKMGPALMALYKERKINPFASCLPMLIQLPFIFAIFKVFFDGLTKENAMEALYPFVANPGVLNPMAFGFFDLSEKSIIVAILAGLGQFWQTKMLSASNKNAKASLSSSLNKQMLYIFPLFTVFIGSRFPAGVTFYWLLTTLFSIGQQYIVLGRKKKQPAGTAEVGEVIDKK